MLRTYRRLAVALGWAAIALTTAAAATSVPAQAAAVSDSQDAKDAKIVQKALTSRSLEEFAAQASSLQAVLDRAPKSYPLIERRGDRVIVRAEGDEAQLKMLMVLMQSAAADKKAEVDIAFNTYGMAAMALGSIAVSQKRPQDALEPLDKGLALQPDNLMLVTEKGTALSLLRRHEEALALYDKTAAMDAIQTDEKGRARLLRAKGFALIELERLDEAETCYREALTLEPGHGGAQQELAYITQRRSGGQRAEMGAVTTEEAKTIKPAN